jgi:HAD superfamily hydrolase (TIGR01509 family)
MFRLILFDFDGVLVISNKAHVEVCRKALGKVGIDREIGFDEITYYFGRPYRDVLQAIMGEDYTPEKLETAYREQRKLLYSDWFFENVREIKGVREFLLNLKKKGIKIALASGNERAFLWKALHLLNLEDVFDLVLSAEDVRNSKPDPEMVYKAMKKFNVNPGETLFVGDAINDILAAKKAEVKSAVVLTGVLDRVKAEELNPDFILKNVLEVDSIAI